MALSILRTLWFSYLAPTKKESCFPTPLPNHQDLCADSTQYTVCIIHPNSNGPSQVVSQPFTDQIGLHDVPAATAYKLLTMEVEPTLDDNRLLKPVRKGTASLEKVCQFLQGPAHNHASKELGSSPVFTVGNGAFIFCPGLEDKEKDLSMIQIYTKVQLQFGNGFSSTQYYHPYSSAVKPAHLKSSSPFQRIDINTGICLYSKASLGLDPGNAQVVGDEGKPVIPRLPHNIKPTIYELEAIMRLSSAIADTVSLVGHSNRSPETVISINIDIPDIQYYWTACELFEKGHVDLEFTKAWIAAIDRRRGQLANIMTTVLRSMIVERHVDGIEINITTGTEAVAELIKSKLDAGETPSMEEALSVLKSQGPNAARWRGMFNNMDPRDHPTNMLDFGRLVYIFKAVRSALEREDTEIDCSGKRLIIQIDNIAEWRIMMRSKDFLKRYFKSLPKGTEEDILIGLFPIERIFLAGTHRSELYSNDTNTGLRLDESKINVSPVDLVSATYGHRMGRLLDKLCQQEGLR
ncbi:uncharacterized protein N7484_002626 [Penicillium longicatenatum]|uniref:uncharacterized protein n=1 Tax=Penicillium longicatenatum TaxID=1561947 RepID=UPI0025483114|nr:uncharacterized protein N7484_002626 [Penicillium longicatenatum]KAJ5648903.1 hypothetical protein N7484_002626 [Penicillium longicatenatum]